MKMEKDARNTARSASLASSYFLSVFLRLAAILL